MIEVGVLNANQAWRADLQGEDLFLGVDIGGTKIAAGVVDHHGAVKSRVRVPMVSNGSAQQGLDAVLTTIASVLRDSGTAVSGIGICSPGPLDPETGVVLNPPNIPCWRNFPLADAVRSVCGLPVKVDNDANAAALAEALWGAAQGYKIVFYATIGTGIGSGIVFDQKIYHGRTGAAGEGGHVSVDYRGPICACGKPGCIEILASGTAIARRAREQVASGRTSTMPALAGGNIEMVTGEIVGRASASGDPVAKEILAEATDLIALWLGNIVDLLDPDVIVIGGGAAKLLHPFWERLTELLPKLAVNPRADEVPVLKAHYGEDSGIAGGAALCVQ